MTEQTDELLLERQRVIEENAIGLGLARAARTITGERTKEDVEEFGGSATDGAKRRKKTFLYTMVFEGLAKLSEAIAKRHEESKSKYKVLNECGTDAEVAGVTIKTVFTAVCIGRTDRDDDDDEVTPGDDTGVSIISVAQELVEALLSLHHFRKKKKSNTPKRPASSEKNLSPDVMLPLALELVSLYLEITGLFSFKQKRGSYCLLKMTDSEHSDLKAGFAPEQFNTGALSLRSDIPEQLLANGLVSPKWPPTLVPPKPWNTMVNGGYIGALSAHVTLIKKRKKDKEFSKDKCPEIFDAINRLQETSFSINHCVFSVFSRLFKDFTASLHDKYIQDQTHATRCSKLLNLPIDQLRRYKSGFFRWKHWGQLYTLHNEAESYFNNRFYFVHTCDFRGRFYPKASNLNYQSGDLRRSLLVFSDGKPVTGDAEKWLKRHGANCYAEKNPATGIGIDKSLFQERESWVEKNEQAILDLGRLAKTGGFFDNLSPELEKWWLDADKPWAFLAWAHEWACYRENPHTYNSCLPIDVDGSSNGYQHITALIQSKQLAEMVNMLPREFPSDIYSVVSRKATEDIELNRIQGKDAACLWAEYKALEKADENNDKDFERVKMQLLAISMEKEELPRSIAKKIIMTYPYSATLESMTEKLAKEEGIIRKWYDSDVDPEFNEQNSVGKKTKFKTVASIDLEKYAAEQEAAQSGNLSIKFMLLRMLASIICQSINNLFPVVPQVLQWFKEIGGQASGVANDIRWISPSGFPIRQRYKKKKNKKISVFEGKRKYKMMKDTDEPNQQKHSNAFGPNFIHSCDAAHLVKTVNAAYASGITSFRMIHDSYATHAADLEKLSEILREEFIKIYKDGNILENLRANITRQCNDDSLVNPAPMVNDLDIEQVAKALYFFA